VTLAENSIVSWGEEGKGAFVEVSRKHSGAPRGPENSRTLMFVYKEKKGQPPDRLLRGWRPLDWRREQGARRPLGANLGAERKTNRPVGERGDETEGREGIPSPMRASMRKGKNLVYWTGKKVRAAIL